MIHVIAQCFLFYACLELPIIVQGSKITDSGCRDGTTEALQDKLHPKMAACRGSWAGHVTNSTFELCAPGWRACSWHDLKQLKTIRWSDAIRIRGCYAINAAQESSSCGPCLDDDVTQDNMAGVGRGCERAHRGQSSCISGGRVEATCCRDSEAGMGCRYRRGLISGVVCCKMSGTTPRIISQPPNLIHVTSGEPFILSCLALGSPGPQVTWLRNGVKVNGSLPRISVLDSGYLIIADSREDDEGWYQCVATNRIGGQSSQPSRVIVRDHKSGCASGRTDDLYDYEEIQACKGHWEGHIKRAKVICARGWQVCNPGHVGLLKMITWYDVTSRLEGCYAYNAEVNRMGLCLPCTKGQIAGVGFRCQDKNISGRSCLAEGSVSVVGGERSQWRLQVGQRSSCHYNSLKGKVDGVLCCKRSARRNKKVARWKPPRCFPGCKNGGLCVGRGVCSCMEGFHGNVCQHPICPGGCIENSECIQPKHCRCKKGFYGPNCQDRD